MAGRQRYAELKKHIKQMAVFMIIGYFPSHYIVRLTFIICLLSQRNGSIWVSVYQNVYLAEIRQSECNQVSTLRARKEEM